MMRTSTLWPFLALPLLACSAIASAQTPAKPSEAPPQLERIEEMGEAPITVAPAAAKQQITEKREAGVTSEVKVTSGGSTYYMKPAAGADQANGNALRGPQWKVLEFDLGKKKQKQRDEEAADAPAPPAAAK